jgi:hypothetical protein
MLCSILLRCGIDQIGVIEHEMEEWMEAHEYDSVEELKGGMSQQNCPTQRRSSELDTFGVYPPLGVR